jgi:bifunctional aspartokinase / homoserine dehydrogenase 1
MFVESRKTNGLIAHKFGGSSLASAERIDHVVQLMAGRSDLAQVIVVSAMQGVTNGLIALAEAAAAARDVDIGLYALKQQHDSAAVSLLGAAAHAVQAQFAHDFAELRELLKALTLLGDAPKGAMELISGLGEVFSARLLTACFQARGHVAEFLDAREVLRVEHTELGCQVLWPESEALLAAHLVARFGAQRPLRTVVTGFVARDKAGRVTTLGRNGSDYSGSIFAALLDATEVHIWTDVDGVLSADPRQVPEAQVLNHMSYQEAFELAYFGAKVIHPQTMAPATRKNLPVFIRNTFNPTHAGTRIDATLSRQPPIKGITTIGAQAMVTIEGAGMIGVPGTAERVFSALKAGQVSVVMISQGSSEHSICCVVQQSVAEKARVLLCEAFSRELSAGAIQSVSAEPGIAVLAVVGDGMAGQPGVAARLFAALGRARINVRAIAQGSSERNISVAIREADATRALRAVHAGFYLSAQTISVGLIGPGQVGSALLKQMAAAAPRLRAGSNLDLRIRAIAGSHKIATSELGFSDDSAALGAYAASSTAFALENFADAVQAEHLPHALIVDCSASDVVAQHYASWLARGIHVVTPNKNAGSGDQLRFDLIRANAQSAKFRYEATVGAGLPVISTLRDLLDTGDQLLGIEGMFSGTLAYLFNRFDGSQPFSELVYEAKRLGYTEPDPRDDLSGKDVARKLVILAREMGLKVSLSDVRVESLVPDALAGASVAEFMRRLPEFDAPMQAKLAAAKANASVLRFVAKLVPAPQAPEMSNQNDFTDAPIGPPTLTVALQTLPESHAFAHVALTDNIVQFQTARYHANPLIVRGPGAGPDVTAAGVFADVLRIAASLGAKL